MVLTTRQYSACCARPAPANRSLNDFPVTKNGCCLQRRAARTPETGSAILLLSAFATGVNHMSMIRGAGIDIAKSVFQIPIPLVMRSSSTPCSADALRMPCGMRPKKLPTPTDGSMTRPPVKPSRSSACCHMAETICGLV